MRLLYSRHIEHFLAVHEAQSLRAAAAQCGVTQPALTKSLKLLEATFGVSLFERHPKGLVPTAAAQVLRRHALQIVNSARYVAMEIGMLREGQGGALRIGCGIAWSATRIPGIVADLHRRFPRLAITLQTGIADQLVPALLDGDIDVSIASLSSQRLPSGFTTVELPSTTMAVFARAGHPLVRRRRPVDVADLVSCDLVGFADDSDWQRHTAALFAAHDLPVPPVLLKSTSLQTLLATVAASDSVAILAELVQPQAQAHGLRCVRTARKLWQIGMGISYRTQISEFAPLQALLAAVRAT
jgi:LysR family transcriptional regulator of abg operon